MPGVARTLDVVLALTLCVGLAGVIVTFAIARFGRFKSDAGARYNLSFALLIVLAVVAPVLGATTMLSTHTDPIIHTAAPTVSIDVTPVMPTRVKASNPTALSVYQPPRPEIPRFPFNGVLAVLWLCGVALVALRVVAGMVRLRQFVREGQPVGTRSTERGSVRVFAHPRLRVPVAIGYRHPAVLIPQMLLDTASDDEIEHMLLHELEHLRRYDDVTSLVQAFCMAIVWFNPFAHVVQRWIAVDREMACDEAVVRRIGARHGYASTLWNIALDVADARVPHVATAFAEGAHTVRRVTNLLESTHARVSRSVFAIVTMLVLGGFIGASIAGAAAVSSLRPVVSDAATVALPDGTSLVIGGRNTDGTAIADATIYGVNHQAIGHVPLAVPRWSPTLTRLRSGDVLVTGGMTPNGTTADVEVFNWRARSFERVGRMRVGRVAHTATLLPDGTVLIAAGERAPGKLESSTELYDTATRTFRLTADGYGRISQTAIRIDNGDVLMMGGDPGPGRKRCSIIYSASRHKYYEAGTLVRATATHVTFELPGRVFVTHTIN